MTNRLFLGAYWPARREAIERCADRLHGFFVDLVACDPTLATWYQLGRSRKQALQKRVDVSDRHQLLNLLDRGRNRHNIGHTVVEELGFQVGLWNGGDEGKEAGLGVTCGLYWVSPHPNVSMSNCVTLDLPEDLGELKQAERMTRVLAAVARAWDPDWAGVMSQDAMDARNFDAREPFVDWMLYLSRKLAPQIPELACPARVQQIDELGSIIMVQDEPPDATNAAHLQHVDRVAADVLP